MRILAICLFYFQLQSLAFAQGEKILDRHLSKYGQSTWSELRTLKIEGKHVTQDYKAFPLMVYIKENQQIRVEAISKSEGYILMLNQQEFWSRNYSETKINSALTSLILDHSLTIGSPLAKYQEELKYHGLEIYQGTTFHAFKRVKDNYFISYLIDKENDQLRHIICTLEVDEPETAILSFQKYKSHHGLLMPTAMTIAVGEAYKEWVFDEILLGQTLEDQLFTSVNSQ